MKFKVFFPSSTFRGSTEVGWKEIQLLRKAYSTDSSLRSGWNMRRDKLNMSPSSQKSAESSNSSNEKLPSHNPERSSAFPSRRGAQNWWIDRCGRGVYQSADAFDRFCCGYDSAMHERALYDKDSLMFRRIEVTPTIRLNNDGDGDSYTAPFTFDEDGDSLLSDSEMTYQINLAGILDPFGQQSLPAEYKSRAQTFDTASDASFITAASYGYYDPGILGNAKKESNTGRQRLPWAKDGMDETKQRPSFGNSEGVGIQRLEPNQAVTLHKELEVSQESTPLEKANHDLVEHPSAPCSDDLISIRTNSDLVQKSVMCGLDSGAIAADTKVVEFNNNTSNEVSQQLALTTVAIHQPWKDPVQTMSEEQAYKHVSDLVSQAATTSAAHCQHVSALVSQAAMTSAQNIAVLVSGTKKDVLDTADRLMSSTEQSVTEITDRAVECAIHSASSFTPPTVCTPERKPLVHDDPIEFAQFEVSCVTVKPQVKCNPFHNAAKHHRLIEI